MKNYLLLLLIFCVTSMTAQTVYDGNGNNSFSGTSNDSGAVGGSTLEISDFGGFIDGTFTKGDAVFDQMLVIYISTGANGRAVIDGDVDDTSDDYRKALSSPHDTITFHKGFQATHAIVTDGSVSPPDVRLYKIPATGSIGNGDLSLPDGNGGSFPKNIEVFPTQDTFEFNFKWDDLDLNDSDSFRFVATYVDIASSPEVTSNEGYDGDFMEVTSKNKITGNNDINDNYAILNSYTYPSPNKNDEILYNDLPEYFNPFNTQTTKFGYGSSDEVSSWAYTTLNNDAWGGISIFENPNNDDFFELNSASFVMDNWDKDADYEFDYTFTLELYEVDRNAAFVNDDPELLKGDTIAVIDQIQTIQALEDTLSIRNAAYTSTTSLDEDDGSPVYATNYLIEFDLDNLLVDVDEVLFMVVLDTDGASNPNFQDSNNDGTDDRLTDMNIAVQDFCCSPTPTIPTNATDSLVNYTFWRQFGDFDWFPGGEVMNRFSGNPATVIEWTGNDPSDNNFGTSGNWSSGGNPGPVPGVNDNAVIPAGTPTAVIPDGSTIELKNINVEDTLEVRGTLAVSNNLVNYGQVTFKSDAGYTGQLGKTGNIRGTGEFTVERFVPKSNRAFRYIGSPVNTTGTINANLQEGATTATPETDQDAIEDYGTHITGGDQADGFDQSLSNNPSMFEWNETIQDWDAISSTKQSGDEMAVGDAYALMVRGDRTTPLNSIDTVGPATTLRFTGDLVVGDFDAPDLSATDDDFNLVANPYQAIVDMKTLYNNDAMGLNQHIYVYDPTQGTQGGYETIDLSSPNPTSIPSGSADENILPNQAFFIQTDDSNITPTTLTFRETYKNTGATFVDTFSDDASSVININLHRQPQDVLVDGVSARFNSGHTNAVNNADADKVWNFDERVALFNANNYLSIEKRATPVENDTLQIYTGNYQSDNYVWNVDISNINREAVLYDAYNDQDHPLNANATTNIAFTVDENLPGTVDPYRFLIVFQEETLSDENFERQKVRIYPNPVNDGAFNIQGLPQLAGDQAVSLTIYDLLGKQVYQKTLNNVQATEIISVDKLNTGSYILELNTNNNTYNYNLIFK